MLGMTNEELKQSIKGDVRKIASSIHMEIRRDIHAPTPCVKDEYAGKIGNLLLDSLTEVTIKLIEENNKVITSQIENLLKEQNNK